MRDIQGIAEFVSEHDRERIAQAMDKLGVIVDELDLSLANAPGTAKADPDLQVVINTASVLGLTAVYYFATPMVANGRFTLLTTNGARPQVLCNPAAVDALVQACEAAGIDCQELTPEAAENQHRYQ